MPCGGIFPVRSLTKELVCGFCGKPGADHFVEEWDDVIHGECVEEFLKTEEGKIILDHKHPIIVKQPDGSFKDLSNRKGE